MMKRLKSTGSTTVVRPAVDRVRELLFVGKKLLILLSSKLVWPHVCTLTF